jgi:hypothetical protein
MRTDTGSIQLPQDRILAGNHARTSGRKRHSPENLAPPDDDAWSTDPAYAQNAAASVAYAVGVWQSNDPGDAEVAARQVYGAANFGAWALSPIIGSVPPVTAQFIERQQVVQIALQGIESDLSAAEGASDSTG